MGMEIKTYGDPPKTLLDACRKHASKIVEIGNEGEDGYWIYLRDGWWNAEASAAVIHEYTVRQCIDSLRFIEPDPRAAETA